jgi:hypothetical protein
MMKTYIILVTYVYLLLLLLHGDFEGSFWDLFGSIHYLLLVVVAIVVVVFV